MTDFLAALGLVMFLEGLCFAAFPDAAKKAMAEVAEAAPARLRLVGLIACGAGLLVVWLVRHHLS